MIIRFEKCCFILLSATLYFKIYQNTLLLIVFKLSPNIFIGNTKLFTIYPQICLPGFFSSFNHYPMFQPLQTSPWSPQELLLFLKDPAKCNFLHAISRFLTGSIPVCFHVLIRAWQETNGTSTRITWGHFLKWAVIGEQIQEAHCERNWGIQYFTTSLFFLLIYCQGPRWLNPNRSQKEKELLNTLHPDQSPQGKELGGESWRVAIETGKTEDIQAFLFTLKCRSIAMTCFHEYFPTGFWPCHHYLWILCTWQRIWSQ